jgi:hypothetical protein
MLILLHLLVVLQDAAPEGGLTVARERQFHEQGEEAQPDDPPQEQVHKHYNSLCFQILPVGSAAASSSSCPAVSSPLCSAAGFQLGWPRHPQEPATMGRAKCPRRAHDRCGMTGRATQCVGRTRVPISSNSPRRRHCDVLQQRAQLRGAPQAALEKPLFHPAPSLQPGLVRRERARATCVAVRPLSGEGDEDGGRSFAGDANNPRTNRSYKQAPARRPGHASPLGPAPSAPHARFT